MALFDVKKDQTPKPNEIDMKASKYNFEIFMAAYGSAREKVGKNRMSKMTQSFSPIPSSTNKQYSGDAEKFLIEREEFMQEYEQLHDIFTLGYLSIANPLKQDGTERRRQIFMLRYIYGIGVSDISERTYLGKTTIVEESQLGFIQFCKATELIIYSRETEPLVEMN